MVALLLFQLGYPRLIISQFTLIFYHSLPMQFIFLLDYSIHIIEVFLTLSLCHTIILPEHYHLFQFLLFPFFLF